MKLFVDSERYVSAIRTSRPAMSWKNGRGWDGQSKLIDGQDVRFYFETQRGRRMYFRWNSEWFVSRMFQDCDPFEFHEFTTHKPKAVEATA